MKRHYQQSIVMLLVALISLSAAQENHAAPTIYRVMLPFVTRAAAPSIYWGAAVKGPPFDMSKLATFEADAGKRVSIFHWTHSWVEQGAYKPFLTGEFNAIRAHGAIPMLTWTTDEQGKGLSQPSFQLSAIASGAHDAYIRQWATDAKAWGHPLFLRLNHEMNGWWFVWSEQNNGNQPGDFVRAWRHIHDIFVQVGASNVTWVWCVNATGTARLTPAAALYPGDAYVDWVAMDGYNFGSDSVDGWLTAEGIFRTMYTEITGIAPSKPVMIAETASSEHGGPLGSPASKAAWISNSFATIPDSFPRVRAVLWFNQTDSANTYTWPIESSPNAISAFANVIGASRYADSAFSGLSAAPIPPLKP